MPDYYSYCTFTQQSRETAVGQSEVNRTMNGCQLTSWYINRTIVTREELCQLVTSGLKMQLLVWSKQPASRQTNASSDNAH